MRRWVCIVASLAGFSGEGYAWSARARIPIPVERLLDPAAGPGAAGGGLVEPDLSRARARGAAVEAPARRLAVRSPSPSPAPLLATLARWAADPVAPTPAVAADPTRSRSSPARPSSIDPAQHGDLGQRVSYVSQLYETLTAVDPSLAIRPALAESWAVEDGGTAGDLHPARRT